ncbi:MAG: hypothetical protein ACTS73_02730 [Arsenophonus sp. NEOnobi-MAG3]
MMQNILNAVFRQPFYTIIRNSYLLQRTIQTGIGNVEIKLPKVKQGRLQRQRKYVSRARCYCLI